MTSKEHLQNGKLHFLLCHVWAQVFFFLEKKHHTYIYVYLCSVACEEIVCIKSNLDTFKQRAVLSFRALSGVMFHFCLRNCAALCWNKNGGKFKEKVCEEYVCPKQM